MLEDGLLNTGDLELKRNSDELKANPKLDKIYFLSTCKLN